MVGLAAWDGCSNTHNGALCNFWRSAENVKVSNHWKSMTWAVSQASPIRRIVVDGDLHLTDRGWSSGGYMADMKVSGKILASGQQQYFSRNTDMGSWSGG
jgi:hypothetical protein